MSRSFRPTRILVLTDFSPSADMSIDAGAALAREFRASIFLLHVIPMFPESGYSTVFFPVEDYLADARISADDKMRASIRDLQAEGLEVAYGIELGNDVVGNIMMVLSRERCDLMIIATHGVSGWRPIVFGSIAEQVIKLVECPLLLLRTPKPKA